LTVNYTVNDNPAQPPLPSITNNCGSTVLTRSNPPSGITWYWQSSANGTDTSTTASSASITLTSGTTYYLRAKSDGADCWSTSRTVTYSISGASPPNPIDGQGCGGTVEPISAQSLNSEGVSTHRWYTASSGGSLVTSGITQNVNPASGYYISTLNKNFTSTETYYVAAVCDGAESTRTPVTFTVNAAAPISIQVVGGAKPKYCEDQTVDLEAINASNYKWRKDSATSTILGTSSTFSATTSGTYYLTANRSCGDEQTRSITLTFDTPELPVLASNVPSCGSVTLTLESPTTTDQKYYWQTDPTYIDTTDFATTKTFSSSGTIYLRSKFEFTDCWGPALQVDYSVSGNAPEIATSTSEIVCGAGEVVDLIAIPGTGADTIRWFDTPTGGNLLETGNVYRVSGLTQQTTYYAESYNSTGQCSALTNFFVSQDQ